ncbi:hypothetical protein DFP72DRAFT_1063222 [Ephemerocybe angulata]|uniref:NFX1-type zinc finger-containing protein 1 n=1 Tax=Ephemerocybe angulata TaxID=980116 RepID=A0A8H6IA91_9AGAR|nr:hypothetical protein DFP72DRAFT_1063222 [Tulosesus angulatus]
MNGWCRDDDVCRFSHERDASTTVATPSTTSPVFQDSPRTATWRTSPVHQRTNTKPPTCRFWLLQGWCRDDDVCRFSHERDASITVATPNTISPVPLLDSQGIATLDVTNSDIFRSLSEKPLTSSEITNIMKPFLFDNFRFHNTFKVYAFWVPFQSAHRSNSNWSDEDGQVLLNTVAKGNGLLRIGDIIRWPDVSLEAGLDRETLSFQRGYYPLLSMLSSDFVLKSTRNHLVHSLYFGVLDNLECFAENVEGCVELALAVGSFKDPNGRKTEEGISGFQVFHSLAVVLFECLNRFKNAIATYPQLGPLVKYLVQWIETWAKDVSSTPPAFVDPMFAASSPEARNFTITHLRENAQRLLAITEREQKKIARVEERRTVPSSWQSTNEDFASALSILYKDEGPGALRRAGPRHDNDHEDIHDIRIAPTEQELICSHAPYLPANFFEAPHHGPRESMERLLDIQYRLFREEGSAPLRTSIQLVRNDILNHLNGEPTQLSGLINRGGGKYRGNISHEESVMFNVYTNVTFLGLCPDRRGISAKVSFDTPPGRARAESAASRTEFWESIGGKRLMQGGLVALVWEERGEVGIHLGILATRVSEVTEFVATNAESVIARIVFFDVSVQLRILQCLRKDGPVSSGIKILVESPVMYEAIRPFLEALCVEPETLPFSTHLVHRPPGFFEANHVLPPKYARMPGFEYQLSHLFPREKNVLDMKLSPMDSESVSNAREALRRNSRLDPSQADAVIATLTREVALIQGPPGTGKSFVGIELIRILIDAGLPILMLAFTNHALDHMLRGILDADITDDIVRLGGRCTDPRVSPFSIDKLEQNEDALDTTLRSHYRDLKESEKEIETFVAEFLQNDATPEAIDRYLAIHYPEHYEHLWTPPDWVEALYSNLVGGGRWERAKSGGRTEVEEISRYSFWLQGQDIGFLSAPKYPKPLHKGKTTDTEKVSQSVNRYDVLSSEGGALEEEEDEQDCDGFEEILQSADAWPQDPSPVGKPEGSDRASVDTQAALNPGIRSWKALQNSIADSAQPKSNVEQFLLKMGIRNVPGIPSSNRKLELLVEEGVVWTMSLAERKALHDFWGKAVLQDMLFTHEEKYEELRYRNQEAQEIYNECKDDIKRRLLRKADIVGCTTTGAAKLSSLLKSISPRVLLVEEAGQVLEAHILGTLVQSVEHLILIGDPLQLRPMLNNYSLSMDSTKGRKLFRFDMSLMERLSSSGFPMSQIDVQRRMRPEISNLIRHTLYPNLTDNDFVKNYPNVRGFAKNVFFLDHEHPENDGSAEDTSSKFNTYEVDMIRDMVIYLLRQGCYSQEGDIVVLCAYLGQLAKVRDALRGLVAVVIDERDQTELADCDEEQVEFSQIQPSQPRWGCDSIDNFQGEEARIVILSLVRNAGPSDQAGIQGGLKRTIGFLRSDNRTNVSLSRAREGLFILGNKAQLTAKSPMWKGVLEELESNGCVGKALPISCHRHPEILQHVSQPGRLHLISPDGGCLQSCDTRLKCGHVCPYKTTQTTLGFNASKNAARFVLDTILASAIATRNAGSADTRYPKSSFPVATVHPSSSGNVLTPSALFPVDQSASDFLAMKDARSCCDVVIHVLPFAEKIATFKDDTIVDLVMGRRMGEIPVDSEDSDDILISLPKCGHVFTVETLDGVCGIKDWYDYDDNVQRWSGLRVPASKKPVPVCPTCRAAITSPRYGRIYKAADLDILEKNVINKMTQGLGSIQEELNAIDGEAIALAITRDLKQISALSSKPPDTPQVAQVRRKAQAILSRSEACSEPVDASIFTDGNLFPFAAETADSWGRRIRRISQLVSDITRVVTVRSAHTHAWESAYTYLYNKEIDLAASEPKGAPRNPQEHAARMARLKLGQPQPRADQRFIIEGVWISVTLRLILLSLVSKVLEVMSSKPAVFNGGELGMWSLYGRFIHRSCEGDCKLAYNLAEKSQARRQMTISQRFALRTGLDTFCFKMSTLRCMRKFGEKREELLVAAGRQKDAASALVQETFQSHLRVKMDDQAWLQDNFTQVTSKILKEWEKIERSLRMDTFYQPISVDEQRDIVKAMGFSHTGHWYNCPNGHTFVITECGGATQRARCPECGEAIGGENHNILPNNQRADDFEALTREQGAARSPWAWGL